MIGSNESICQSLYRPRRDHQDHREGPGAGGLLRPGLRGRCGVGGLLPDRPQAAASGPDAQAAALGHGGSGDSRLALPGVVRRGRRHCRDDRPAPARASRVERFLAPPLGRGAAPPAQGQGRGRPAAGHPRGLADARPRAAVRLEQADQRRVPRRRLAAARDAGPGHVRQARSGRRRSSVDGRLGADAAVLRAPAGPRPGPTRTSAGPIPSSSPIRWSRRPSRSATSPCGRPNGNGTASAPSSSAEARRPSSGRAGKSW